MQVQVKELEYCKIQVTYIAEPDKVAQKRRDAVVHFRKSKIAGYRQGKAPDYVIQVTLKKQIDEWLKHELIASAYDDILFETKAKPIGYPHINSLELHDSEFWCDLTILKKPDIELKQYKGFEIPKPHQQATSTEVAEQLIQELRVKFGEVNPYGENDFVQVGDKVTLDFKCSIDGKIFDGATREGILYTVGENIFPEFDDNICGMSAGEERVFDVVFANNAPEELKEKRATFTVKIHMGMKTIPAPLDDALAQKMGLQTYNKLREAAEANAGSRLQAAYNQMIAQQVIKRILAEHDFVCPEWLISMEAQQLSAQTGSDWKVLTDEQKTIFSAQAKDNVKLALVMDEIREKEPEAVFNDDELVNVIKQRVSAQGQDPDKFLVEAQKDGRLIGILASLRNEAMLQWLVAQSKIVE